MNNLLLEVSVAVYDIIMMTFLLFTFRLRNKSKSYMVLTGLYIGMAVEGSSVWSLLVLRSNILAHVLGVTLGLLAFATSLFLGVSRRSDGEPDEVTRFLFASSIAIEEVSMGYVFSLVFGPFHMNPLVASVSNPAYGLMMAVDSLLVFFTGSRELRSRLPLLTFSLAMAFMPNEVISLSGTAQSVYGLISSVAMAGNVIAVYGLQSRMFLRGAQAYSLTMAALDGLMMVGMAVYGVSGNVSLLSIAMVIAMAGNLYMITSLGSPWSRRKFVPGKWIPLLVVILLNLSEMSMALGENDLVLHTLAQGMALPQGTQMEEMSMNGMTMEDMRGNSLWFLFPMDPWRMAYSGFLEALSASNNIVISYIWGSYLLIMMTSMLPFYVIMMGAEMSILVIERYRYAKNKQVKDWTVGILMGVPLFVVLIPYYTPGYIFGMSGMLSKYDPFLRLTVVGLTLSLAGILSTVVLKGRRVYCNLICMSAHMWSNSYYHNFRRLNREYLRTPHASPRGRDAIHHPIKLPSMDLSSIMSILSAGIMVGTLVWEYGIMFGFLRAPKVFGRTVDPLELLGMFTLNYIWWFFFYMTPIAGTFSCARDGWCGFGSMLGVFNKLSFKVRPLNRETCLSCETKSCSNCPVGIDVYGEIVNRGYVNIVKCVGCGECLEECPYQNLEFRDLMSRLRGSKRKSLS